MIKRYGIPFFIFSLFLHLSCEQKEKEDVRYLQNKQATIIDLKLEETPQNRNFYTVFKDIHILQLETSEKSLVTDVSKVLDAGDKIIILDRRRRAVRVFDTSGHFLHDIGEIGRGPGEFLAVSDCLYDSATRSVYICSNESSSVLKYTIDGIFLGAKKLKFFPFSFLKIGNDFAIFTNNNSGGDADGFNMISTDSSFKVKNHYFPLPRQNRVTYASAGFMEPSPNSSILYNEALNDTIYEVNQQNEVFPKYFFKFSKYQIPVKLKDDYDEFSKRGFEYSFLRNSTIENDSLLIFSYVHKRLEYTGFFDKRNHSIITGREFRESFFINAWSPPVGVLNGYYVVKIDPPFLRRLLSEYNELTAEISKNLPLLATTIAKIKEDDNPLLLLYKL